MDEAIKDPDTHLAQKRKDLEDAQRDHAENEKWGKGASVEELHNSEQKVLAAQKEMEEAENYKLHKNNIDKLNDAGRELEAAKVLEKGQYKVDEGTMIQKKEELKSNQTYPRRPILVNCVFFLSRHYTLPSFLNIIDFESEYFFT